MKKMIIILIAAFTVKSATAQLSISPEIGYQMSKLRYKAGGDDEVSDFKSGMRFGANIGLGISNHHY